MFRLLDGSLTRDQSVAEQDRKCRAAQHQNTVNAAMAALLRVPVVVAGWRRTPERVQAVRDLVASGVLPAVIERQVDTFTTIDDATWKPVSRLRELTQPEEVECGCWNLTLLDDRGQCLEVPGDYDPLEHRGTLLSRALDSLLVALNAEGWSVKSVVTKFYPPDDSDACREPDDDWVRGVSYELVRPAPNQSCLADAPCDSGRRGVPIDGICGYTLD